MQEKITFKQKVLIFLTLFIYKILRLFGRQGSTKPGSWLYRREPNLLPILAHQAPLVLVSGTNGKTTTTSFIVNSLREVGYKVGSNFSGANLRAGLLTALAINYQKVDIMVLEIDEAVLIAELMNLKPDVLVLTNLFRDQLDRYGELHHLYEKIKISLEKYRPPCLILNADDPLLSSLETTNGCIFYGSSSMELAPEEVDENSITLKHTSTNNMLCPLCHLALAYKSYTISHLGDYFCPNCGYKKPLPDYHFSYHRDIIRFTKGNIEKLLASKSGSKIESYTVRPQLKGLYNAYNFNSALACVDYVLTNILSSNTPITFHTLVQNLAKLKPGFGRLERLQLNTGHNICFLLVKNPAGYTQALDLLTELDDVGALVLGLNANLQDGTDVSWIWDIPLEHYFDYQLDKDLDQSLDEELPLEIRNKLSHLPAVFVGERAEDLALRFSYAWVESSDFLITSDVLLAISEILAKTPKEKTVYLLLNYTCMLDVRNKMAKKYGFSHFW